VAEPSRDVEPELENQQEDADMSQEMDGEGTMEESAISNIVRNHANIFSDFHSAVFRCLEHYLTDSERLEHYH
jgi:hypothetical protein